MNIHKKNAAAIVNKILSLESSSASLISSMRKFTADYIFPVSSSPLPKGIVVVADDGEILSVFPASSPGAAEGAEHHRGIICPGFVNTHCHLELSYLKGKIPPGGGLDTFIKEVEELRRKASDDEREQCMRDAEKEMFENGIVAVGDICNTASSFQIKREHKMRYHNFIEVYGFDPARSGNAFEHGLRLLSMPGGQPGSVTLHAPYSASVPLMEKIAELSAASGAPLSFHNQENKDEDELYVTGRGRIMERLKYFGIDTSSWKPTGMSALRSVLPHLPASVKIQLVHNTFTSPEDIEWAESYSRMLWWCFCPGANLYIENCIPAFELFAARGVKITIGTDSLASNNTLSIVEELKIIESAYPAIPLETMIRWATLNGAEFLGFDKELGSIEPGKRPGLVLIEDADVKQFRLGEKSRVRRLC